MNIEELHSILTIGETVAVEFKRCGNGIENDTYETVCSFLNRFGGDLFLGVLDDGTVVGVPEKAAPDMVKNFIKVISNLESSAAEKGFKLLLCNSKEQPEKEQDYLDMCISNRVAGIVLCSKYVQTREFRKMNIPVVNLERGGDDDTISVQCDNYQGGKLAAEHLIECGCKNLLHFGGVAGKDMPADRRADGFSDVCKKAGIPYRILVSDRLQYGSMHYEDFIRRALQEFPDVDGIFASSDLIASQVIQVGAQMDKHVPEDIQLVGFDDVMISTVTTPQITTIHQPVEEMAELCVEYITKSLKNEPVPQKIVLPVRLVQRGTTVLKTEI